MMTIATAAPLMTTEELLALPDDGVDRELIRGHLVERPVTRRSRPHSRTEARIAMILGQWLEGQPEPKGEVLSGEAGVRLRRNPDSTVGVDVAYISAATAQETPDNAFLIEGPPVLAVEILSPSDTQEEILEKVREYLDTGVKLVWLVEPKFRTVVVYRPDSEPVLYNVQQELPGDPHLPGLRVKVAEIFAR
jgi:Uma2 family endonuclease